MKRLAVITTSLLLTLTAAGGAAYAFADEAENSETQYPKNEEFIKTLTFTDLTDYEVEDEKYYFLDNETYLTFENGELGEFTPEEDFAFSEARSEVTTEGYYFYFDDNGELTVYEKSSKVPKTFEGGYTSLKQFGDKAYAIKENVLYCFEGLDEPEKVELNYADYSLTQYISVGQTADKLKDYEALTFVTVKAGTYMTAIDLTALEGEYFVLDDVEADISENTLKLEQDAAALLLCYTGNAAIVSIGDTAYLLLNDGSTLEEKAESCYTEAGFENATIVGNRIYASPFTVIGTTLLPNATGTIVTVKHKLELEGVLNSVYYEVEFTVDEETVMTGYVAEGFLTKYIIEDNKEPETVPDPDYNDKTSVTTVLLILAVVVLVLIAVGYVVYTATSGKNKKEKSDKTDTKDAQKS